MLKTARTLKYLHINIYSPFIHQKLVDIINKWKKTNDLNNLTTEREEKRIIENYLNEGT